MYIGIIYMINVKNMKDIDEMMQSLY